MTFQDEILRFKGLESSPAKTLIMKTFSSMTLVALGITNTFLLKAIITTPWFDIDEMLASNFTVDLTF